MLQENVNSINILMHYANTRVTLHNFNVHVQQVLKWKPLKNSVKYKRFSWPWHVAYFAEMMMVLFINVTSYLKVGRIINNHVVYRTKINETFATRRTKLCEYCERDFPEKFDGAISSRKKGSKNKLMSWKRLRVLEYRATVADLFRLVSPRYRICTLSILSCLGRKWIEWRKKIY